MAEISSQTKNFNLCEGVLPFGKGLKEPVMTFDSIQKRLDSLGEECDKLASITQQMFDDLELMAQHVEIYHANHRTTANVPQSHGGVEMQEFVADELTQIRKLIEAQGQLFCDWICRETRPGETSRNSGKSRSSLQTASA